MALNQLVTTARVLRSHDNRITEDCIDRLIGTYSVVLIGVFTLVLTTSQFTGRPITAISCFCPAEFTGEMVDYTNSICWTKGTFFIPPQTDLPILPNQNYDRAKLGIEYINYYQWTPFILMAAALCFFFPGFIWRNLSSSSYTLNMVTVLNACRTTDEFYRSYCSIGCVLDNCPFSKLAQLIDDSLTLQHRLNNSSRRSRLLSLSSLASSRILCSCYWLCKSMSVISCVLVIFCLNHFMYASEDLNATASVTARLAHKYNHTLSHGSSRFPLSTLCEFSVRGMGDKTQNYLVHCSIPINTFNSKIFGFLYWWTLACICLGLASMLSLSTHILFRKRRRLYVQKILLGPQCPSFQFDLRAAEQYSTSSKRTPGGAANTIMSDMYAFVDQYLGADGVLVLKKMDREVRDRTVDHLWSRFVARRQFIMIKS